MAVAPATASAANPIQAENALAGDSSWQLGPKPPAGALEGYSSATSVAPGDSISFAVRTEPGARYRIAIARLGWYAGAGGRLHACLPDPDCTTDEPGVAQPPPPPPDASGKVDAGWLMTDTLDVPDDWVSGYYVAKLILTSGTDAGASTWIPFVVRQSPTAQPPSQVVVQAAVNTWEAYNIWGGKSLYKGDATTDGQKAVRVSFNRPYTYEVLVTDQAASLAHYEIPLVRFLERSGVDVSYVTDVDVAAAPGSLLSHRVAMTAGHDEYWTKSMRDGFDAARDAGTNLAFMGANTAYWQIRYEDGLRTIVAYKSQADPISDPAQKTVRFRDLATPRPECRLLGVQHQLAFSSLGDPRAYTVTTAGARDAWTDGTGLTAGTAIPYVVGYEWDAVQPGCEVPPVTILFQWVRGPSDNKPSDAHAVRYTAGSGARVFSTGAMQFAWGLDDSGGSVQSADPRVQAFMRNVLADLLRPAPPTAISARITAVGVELGLQRPPDPRFERVEVYSHGGASDFAPGDPGVAVVCSTIGSSCLAPPPPASSTERFAAVVFDRWGTASTPVLSGPVSTAPAPPPKTGPPPPGRNIVRDERRLRHRRHARSHRRHHHRRTARR